MDKLYKKLIWITIFLALAINGIWIVPILSFIFIDVLPFQFTFIFLSLLSTATIVVLFGVAIGIIIYKFPSSRYEPDFVNLLRKVAMIIKLATIPFFLITFLIFALLVLGMMNPFLLFFSPIVAVIGILMVIGPFILTSVLPIIAFSMAKFNNYLSNKALAFLIISQFFSVIDIIGIIVGAILIRRNMKNPDALVIDVINENAE